MRVRMWLVVWHHSGQEVADASLAHAHAHRQVVDVLQLHDLLLVPIGATHFIINPHASQGASYNAHDSLPAA